MNGLKIEWGIGTKPGSASTAVTFPVAYTTRPALFIGHHKNSADPVRYDALGYTVDKTSFKTNYYTDVGLDWLAIGY